MTDGVTDVRVRKAMEVCTRDHLLLPQKDGSVKSARVEEVRASPDSVPGDTWHGRHAHEPATSHANQEFDDDVSL